MTEETPGTAAPGRFNRLRNWLSLAGMVLCASAVFALDNSYACTGFTAI